MCSVQYGKSASRPGLLHVVLVAKHAPDRHILPAGSTYTNHTWAALCIWCRTLNRSRTYSAVYCILMSFSPCCGQRGYSTRSVPLDSLHSRCTSACSTSHAGHSCFDLLYVLCLTAPDFWSKWVLVLVTLQLSWMWGNRIRDAQ